MARNYIAIVGLLALAALFASLASWQLERAAGSRATLAAFDGGTERPVLEALPDALNDAERFRRVEVRGAYVAEPQFLLDNMLHDGVAGYHVLTPLRVHGDDERLLVNRGWVPVGDDRRVLPDVGVGAEARTVTGRLERLPRPALRLGEDGASRGSEPLSVVQYPTAAELATRLGEPIVDYQLLLDAAAPDGYVRDWRAPVLPPDRHLAYAGQWAALALGAVAAALVIAFRTARRRP
jgi:surfeit locus 1 family protein